MGVDWTNFGFLLVLAIFLLPACLVLVSSKVSGYEKLGWSLISLFLSWIGFMVFLITHGGRQTATDKG